MSRASIFKIHGKTLNPEGEVGMCFFCAAWPRRGKAVDECPATRLKVNGRSYKPCFHRTAKESTHDHGR